MRDLLFECFGIALVIPLVLTAWCAGRWLTGRIDLTNSGPLAETALGLGFLGLLNALELALGLGQLIPGNALFLLILLKDRPTWREPLRQFWPLLVTWVPLLLIANVLTPLNEWDAAESYVAHAQHWWQHKAFAADQLHTVYARRPQLMSVLQTWALSWGNASTAQALDLACFFGVVCWIVRRLSLRGIHALLLVMLAAAPTLTGQPSLVASNFLPSVGSGGTTWLFAFLLVALWDHRLTRHPLPWMILGGALLNTQWHAWILLPLLSLTILWTQRRLSALGRLMLPVAFALPWLLWGWIETGSPFYPHDPVRWGGSPMNSLMWEQFHGFSRVPEFSTKAIGSASELGTALMRIGPAILLPFAALGLWRKPVYRPLGMLAISLVLVAWSITSQPRFVFLPLLLGAGLVFRLEPTHKALRFGRDCLIACLIVTTVVSLSSTTRQAVQTLSIWRHGADYAKPNPSASGQPAVG